MHALFKWDEGVSWQRGLLNIAMGYDTSVTGDSEKSKLLTRWALPKGKGRDDDLGSLWLLSHQTIQKAAFIPDGSVCVSFLGAESPGWGGGWGAGGGHRGHVWEEDIWECEGAAGPKCRGLNAPGSGSQERRGNVALPLTAFAFREKVTRNLRVTVTALQRTALMADGA